MRLNVRRWTAKLSCFASCVIVLGTLAFSATPASNRIAVGESAKLTGSIVSRSGDLIQLLDKKSNQLIVVAITGKTKIERKKSGLQFFRHTDMDVTAMLPGLTIEVEGVGNANGQIDAGRISFTPDEFAVEVAEEQQVVATRAAVQEAQSSANVAQDEAIAGEAEARAAGGIAVVSAAAASMINQRVSDLDNYQNAFEVDIFFARNGDLLTSTSRKDLANLADYTKSINGYMIEISGYSSNTLSKTRDQKLSEERAEAVVRYLTQVKNVPMRRILVPVGYGRTHPAVANTDAKLRKLNRRVDIKVLVNQALNASM